MHGNTALQHHHKRKAAEKGTLLSQSRLAKAIDFIIYPIGIAGVSMSLPQAYEIWVLHNASGVSLATWASWCVFSMIWVVYGYIHRSWPIYYINIGWVLVEGFVAFGIVLYQ